MHVKFISNTNNCNIFCIVKNVHGFQFKFTNKCFTELRSELFKYDLSLRADIN